MSPQQRSRNIEAWRRRGVITGCFNEPVGPPPGPLASFGQDDLLITPRTVGAATVGLAVGLFFGYVLGKM